MAEGSDTYMGLAVPLFGDFEIKQRTAATDIATITGASGQTGDFIVAQNSAGTEKFVVDKDGGVTLAQYLNFTKLTTAPTTGLTEGDVFLAMNASTPQIGICYSTAANSIRYVTADTKTFGRTTA